MEEPPSLPYRSIDWDDALESAPAAAAALALGQARVERWLAMRARQRVLDLPMILNMHRVMFDMVWPDFAGTLRGSEADQIPMNVTFGNFRGARHEDVPARCETLAGLLPGYVQQLDALRNDGDAEFLHDQVCRVASYVHCELIEIHPFVNGNGRAARACINYFVARYGFLPVAIERPRAEYLDAIRTYLQQSIVDHFADFLKPLLVRE